ncbi:hypothetical protein SAMN05421858_4763 [Haladaptatus litoreus]|uniref:Uncharacterized protein n=1 Tax=Haladaptatus litoreus TaxID=553468 RepID=A0A1N7F353_9EURY|nr:hypothetical protein [Haladaptatus litoreus]SIR94778.1 hypothetical protein SAMN05421858_4763 [Haladaptatus litoreus]
MMFSDVATQRTLTESADPTERENTPTTERALLDRAQAADVAAAHFLELLINATEWNISTRA